MTIYECDRCHKQFGVKTALHRVDVRLHDWKIHDVYWKETGGGEGELCASCVNDVTALFNDFMKGVTPNGKNDT